MEKITSLANPIIKQLRQIKSTGRERDGFFLVEGENMILSLIDMGVSIRAALIDGKKITDERVISRLQIGSEKVILTNADVIAAISKTKSPQGIIALAYRKDTVFNLDDITDGMKRAVILEDVCDPQNVGTIIRTSAAMGIDFIVTVGGAGIWSPKIIRATAGAFFAQKMAVENDIEKAFKALWEKGFKIYASTLQSGSKNISEVKFHEKCALVIGNEDRGISEKCASLCDEMVNIPMRGEVESLNAASAGAIMIWEMVKGL